MNNPIPELLAAWDAYRATVPRMMGRKALEEFAGNFRRQGYQDASGKEHPWAKRKREDKGKRGKPAKRRAILIKTGNLRRSMVVARLLSDSAVIQEKMPYGRPLQEGSDTMVARPFMVASLRLREAIVQQISKDAKRIFHA